MTILYWVCFVFVVLQSLGRLYRILDKGFSDCDTSAKKMGDVVGTAIAISIQIGIIYFYFH